MSTKSTLGLGALALALLAGVSLPLAAQTGPSGSEKDRYAAAKAEFESVFEEVTLDQPISTVQGRVSDACKRANLVLINVVDWNALAREGGSWMPGTNRLDPAGGMASNVHTVIFADAGFATHVTEDVGCALHPGTIALYEKGGKCGILFMKPSAKLELLKKHGFITTDHFDKEIGGIRAYERKLDVLVSNLKGTRSS